MPGLRTTTVTGQASTGSGFAHRLPDREAELLQMVQSDARGLGPGVGVDRERPMMELHPGGLERQHCEEREQRANGIPEHHPITLSPSPRAARNRSRSLSADSIALSKVTMYVSTAMSSDDASTAKKAHSLSNA